MAKSAFARGLVVLITLSLNLFTSSARAQTPPPSADSFLKGQAIQKARKDIDDNTKRIEALEAKCAGKKDNAKCAEDIQNAKRRLGTCVSCKVNKELEAQNAALYARIVELEKGNATPEDTEAARNMKAMRHLSDDTQAVLAPEVAKSIDKSTLDRTKAVEETARAANGAATSGGPAYGLVQTSKGTTVYTPHWKPDSTPSPKDYFAPQPDTDRYSLTGKVEDDCGAGCYAGIITGTALVCGGIGGLISGLTIDAETFDSETNTLNTTGRDAIIGITFGSIAFGAGLGWLIAYLIDDDETEVAGITIHDPNVVTITNAGFTPLVDGFTFSIAGKFD